MDGRVRDRVADWGERPVEGLDGIRDLADAEFSGVVERPGGEPWFAMLNGAILGVHGGGIEDFERGEALARPAPEPGVALLIAMLAADGEPEDRYYTEDTPVRQAHQTLSSGGFVGYLELSENVLSGDYYVAYYGDRSTPVAFVGSSDRLITGEEALDRADDEVGIYHVYATDLEVVDLPGDDGGTAGAPTGPAGSGRDGLPADTSVDPGSTGTGTAGAAESPTDGASGPDEGGVADRTAPATGAGPDDSPTTADAGDRQTTAAEERSTAAGASEEPADMEEERTEYGSSTSYGSTNRSTRTRSAGPGGDTTASEDSADEGDTDPRSEFYGEVDDEPEDPTEEPGAGTPDRDAGANAAPAETADTSPDDGAAETDPQRAGGTAPDGQPARSDGREAADRSRPPADDAGAGATDRNAGGEPADSTVPARGAARGGPDPAVAEELRERIDEHERRLADLAERATGLETADERAADERRGLRAEVEEMAENLGDLRRTVMRLDRAVEALENGGGASGSESGNTPGQDTEAPATEDADDGGDSEATAAGPDMGIEEALAETTLLLRYGSRGAPTLEAAHDDDDVERAAVEENLRVDVHTPFDDRAATVEGQPFHEFIESRIEYRFFEWLVRDLLFEIRDTGNQAALRDLYDALPEIDRAELRSTVVVGGDDGDEPEEVTFDVVVRDAHERPLVVARINASRDPATEEMVVGLRDSASVVGEDADLAAAFSVTESYFSGTARDAAEEATADSILSRNSKESYVKLSRRSGYHLCLVAVGSDEEFHLRVPDL